MAFHSLDFIQFFLLVYLGVLVLRNNIGARNTVLLCASLFFYGYANILHLGLLAITILVDYFFSRGIQASTDPWRRKALVAASVAVNLSLLGYFKYAAFLSTNISTAAHIFGLDIRLPAPSVVLPIGISFYVFQSMSYTIDVYRGHLQARKSLADFALFVTFFPQLVAGPIERATNLLPQLEHKFKMSYGKSLEGIDLILLGYFKKVVIADNLALTVDHVVQYYFHYSGMDLMVAALSFTFQIYCDFSGYTDIARGIAKLMGIDLMLNFKRPYLASNPSDFWSRWHISLSSWFRDYVYVPLGGNRKGRLLTYRNLMLTMLIAGFWHGARWNFVLWGAYHGILLIAHRLYREMRPTDETRSTAWMQPLKIAAMFAFTAAGWILFRVPTMKGIGHFFTNMSFSMSPDTLALAAPLVLTLPLIWLELRQNRRTDGVVFPELHPFTRAFAYTLILGSIIVMRPHISQQFIYFQF